MFNPQTKVMPVEEFISQHDHIAYCEAIIYPNGEVEYAYPSHMEALLRVYIRTSKSNRDSIYEEMPTTAAPLHWLVQKASCVAVWYKDFLKPETCTADQERSLRMLIEAGVMSKTLLDDIANSTTINQDVVKYKSNQNNKE